MKSVLKNAYDAEAFRAAGHRIIDLLANQLEQSHNVDDFKTINWQAPQNQLDYWNEDFKQPNTYAPDELFQNIIANSINLHSPGYLGHQVPPALPLTVLTSALVSFLNNGMAVYEMGMAGNAMEQVVIAHLAAKFQLGNKASGVVTSGGTLGNLTALLAARAAHTDVWENGNTGNEQLAILVSGEAHYSVDRAARIMGIGSSGVIKVPVNDQFQMRTELLASYYDQAIASGKKVIAVVGCSCSTSTGAFDDLEAIAAFAKTHGLWFHVDGAHGAPAIFSDQHKHLLKGIGKADSIVIDFHKMMMAPSLSTAVLFRDQQQGAQTFTQTALYIYQNHPEYEWFNSGRHTFECTKPATIFHTYTIMRMFGDKLYQENIDILFGLAADFAAFINTQPDFALACQAQSNIVCFRYQAADSDAAINQSILKALLADGKFYIVSTSVKGEFYLRISIMNPLTRMEDLHALVGKIRELAQSLSPVPQL